MALGKITKQILLIVSALVLATATTVCIVKRDAIANFFKSKIKQESLINAPEVISNNSLSKENCEKICAECDNILKLLKERESLRVKNETQEENSVALTKEYKQVCKECDRAKQSLGEAEDLRKMASDLYEKNKTKLLQMPKKSLEEQKESEMMGILDDLAKTRDEATHFCSFLEGFLATKNERLNEIKKTLDEISPGWNEDLA